MTEINKCVPSFTISSKNTIKSNIKIATKMLAVTQSHQRNDDLLKKMDSSTAIRRPNDHFLESVSFFFYFFV